MVGFLMNGCWVKGFLKVGELGADCVTRMSQLSLLSRFTDPLLEHLTSSGDFFPFFSKNSLMSL